MRTRSSLALLLASCSIPLAFVACGGGEPVSEFVPENDAAAPAPTGTGGGGGFGGGGGVPPRPDAGPVGPKPDAGPLPPVDVCGDGFRTGPEACDDGNTAAGDGCSDKCAVEAGWTCPFPNAACFAAECGDGNLAGDEECDDGNKNASDGCSDTCRLEAGFKCPTPNAACVATVCGDGVKEGTEQCDDGPGAAKDTPYDGCHQCVVEPACSGAGCTGVCGDGVKFPNEACDDGDTRSGDGCSATCQLEAGFSCTLVTEAPPDSLVLPAIYRDFKKNGSTDGHPDFQNPCCGTVTGMAEASLDAQGKPALAAKATWSDQSRNWSAGPTEFAQWYRDDAAVNRTVVDTLTLAKQPDGSYVFDSDLPPYGPGLFFPVDGKGWGDSENASDGNPHNFYFTSEVKYVFTYQDPGNDTDGPELEFKGDDDVWVFINGKLAVDIGGVHGVTTGTVKLTRAKATELAMANGGVYQIAVFQAERHTTHSNYKLTLRGFVKAKTSCASVCGDGVKTRDEACDDGAKNDANVPPAAPAYGKCGSDCRARGPFCGDRAVDAAAGEACDDGRNDGAYGGCMPGCKAAAPRCGDGKVDAAFGESCDDGNTTGGDGCSSACVKEGGGGPR